MCLFNQHQLQSLTYADLNELALSELALHGDPAPAGAILHPEEIGHLLGSAPWHWSGDNPPATEEEAVIGNILMEELRRDLPVCAIYDNCPTEDEDE